MAKSKPFTLDDLAAKGYVADENGTFARNNVGKPTDIQLLVPDRAFASYDTKKMGVIVKKTSRPKGKVVIPKDKPEGLQAIERVLRVARVPFVNEHKFSESRKFRFDIAIIDKKIGIEYEGLMSAKSRHTTMTGFTNDTSKYNLAQLEGWKVLRYTALNYKQFVEDLKLLL
jgi:hypothetical protein